MLVKTAKFRPVTLESRLQFLQSNLLKMTASTRPTVHLRPLGFDYKSVAAAAETLSLSFSSDPLICWLYRDPSGPRWDSLLPALQKWQQFRVRSYILDGITIEAVTDDKSPRSVGVCVLHPPQSQYRWLRPWWWSSYLTFYWDLFWNRPDEPLADKKRTEIMLEQHNATFEKIQGQYPPNSLYYLEIAAVKPDTQGMGVGGKLMSWVVNQVGNSPCFLECTNPTNVAFYERYGFKLIEEGKLQDAANPALETSFHYMVREKMGDSSE
ncbi:hypothetical protein B0T10DRAFT_489795 [Thelonectria olida]|uniref:N-acetyltransferase domain-containing protein n=1 Tax=Thelonectria olida TaxID=1576542 RepID=A0A9P9AKI6_9HYPO|nr:hypothetical protein B0T10DRAFT_489795 [Thelonectria olida]